MSTSNKKKFKVTIDDVERELAVVKPNHSISQKAQLVQSKAFKDALKADLLLRVRLTDYMREQGLWDDSKEAELEKLRKSILAGEKALAKGGIKLSEAREIAIQMRRDRFARDRLRAKHNELDQNTVEAFAEQARFNYLVASCTTDAKTNVSVFKDVGEYLERSDEPWVGTCASQFAYLVYGIEEDQEKKLPENKFLIQYKFVNEELHLVNKDGKLVDSKGRLVNEDGNYVNDKGELVDEDGNPLTAEGEYKVEFTPFLDEDITSKPE